ncbi:hypothetical protein [uncultured Fibrobacter sp.]|uniref:hypothetical protein n=1 Tax=uncultured Fibrobacter sp. TaxID=261512 RepID=UPI0025E10C7C|nr:hypothetical protein [uncultured Fibrobacter sp.]
MAINKDMLHAQTHSLFEKAGEVFDGVSKLKERNAELEKTVEELKYTVATLETDLAMAQSWRTTTPPVGVDLLLETGDGFWRVRLNNQEKVDFLVNEGKIKRWIPFPKTIG